MTIIPTRRAKISDCYFHLECFVLWKNKIHSGKSFLRRENRQIADGLRPLARWMKSVSFPELHVMSISSSVSGKWHQAVSVSGSKGRNHHRWKESNRPLKGNNRKRKQPLQPRTPTASLLLPFAHSASARTGQTTVNEWAPIHYIIPVNDTVHRPL